ncbi:hypothetical protein X740_28470 [Mesorhizobium sp. LNHC221B00]|uniref:hypothetical protein n=1 Tax=Mesorhizobium TaxID=68287 RepID=UPI0003CE17C7|nr:MULTISPECIES: hypothetical protein [Mesorhizobium]ESY62264.1 hypothetical protein X742_33750 [Mesorhizobium sp. LNHC232B00]ESY76560.1 hypothetical protein X740_28470 [Mesorhizobium sp. LNHC221B00]WJI38724.1 hypothetical protein NL534_00115 [Mesorhizobium opportunistum]
MILVIVGILLGSSSAASMVSRFGSGDGARAREVGKMPVIGQKIGQISWQIQNIYL